MSQDTAAPRGLPPVVVEETAAVPTHSLFSRLAAEVFGTFVLVLAVIGTLTFNFVNQGSFLPVALAGGLALMAAVAAVGHVSGGHFNLAVSFGMALVGRLGWVHMLGYWLAQLVGA